MMLSMEFIKKARLPLVLLSVLIIPQFVGPFIPVEFKSVSYALSLSMKSILEFLLPVIIFSFIFSCLSNLQKGAVIFVLLLIACVFCSNLSALTYGYFAGKASLSLLSIQQTDISQSIKLIPNWSFHLGKLVSNDTALVFGFISGIFFSMFPNAKAKVVGDRLNQSATFFLKKIFIPFLPVFVLGFVFKLEHENILETSLKIYGPILLFIILFQWLFISVWYLFASQFSPKRLFKYIKNVLPASLTGLSTISSAASMPVLLMATEKNLNSTEKSQMIIPAIVNIHTLGSAIAVPILSLATLTTFGLPIPSFSVFFVFALYTALAKFAVAGVPGGVVIVVAPLLETHLGFTSDMVGLITAVYLICDPFGTTANVTANGAFPIVFNRLYEKASRLILPTGQRKSSEISKA